MPLLSIFRIAVAVVLAFAARAGAAEKDESLRYPLSVVADDEGVRFIADRNLPGIWKAAGTSLAVFHRASKTFRTPLNAVRCVTRDGEGRLLAGDSATREVYRFDEAGKPHPLTEGRIGIPMDIAVDGQGRIFVSDLETQRIWTVPEKGGAPTEFAVVTAPRGLAIDAKNRLWVVSGGGKPRLLRFSPDGKAETVAEGKPFRFPHDVAVDADGTAFVSDGYAKTIWKIEDGEKPTVWISGGPLRNPVGLAWQHRPKADPQRDPVLLIADPHARAVFEADAKGRLQRGQ